MDNLLNIDSDILIELGISLLIVVLGTLIGGWLLFGIARFLARRAKGSFLAQFPQVLKRELRWFAFLLSLQIALFRLDLFDASMRGLLNTIFGLLYLAVIFVVVWRLITAGFNELVLRLEGKGESGAIVTLIPLLRQLSYLLLILVSGTVILAYFGVNISAFVAALGVGGLAISLAAQDTLADAISGALILIDRPFQVGDRIDVSELGAPGEVVEIGLRSSRIRLFDNRQVIVPNGLIARSQVVNYTSPDPIYRMSFEFGVSYDTDLDKVRQVAFDAVRGVEGVLQDRPINVHFWDMADSALVFRLEWWIDVSSGALMTGVPVKEVIYRALVDNGIEVPFTVYDVNLKLGEDEQALFSRTLGDV
jgi:MscS family membrane protein